MAGAGSGVVGAAPSSGLAGDAVSAVRTDTIRVTANGKSATLASWWTFWAPSRLSPRQVFDGSAIHAADFEMSRFRSVLHLITCERIVIRSGAVCSLSRVPTRRAMLVATFSLAASICVPGLALVAIVGAEGNFMVRLALLIALCLLAVVGIASSIRQVFDAHLWRGFGGRGIVIANVAVRTRGVGRGRGLLSEVARIADQEGCTMLLAVRASNVAAVGLYGTLGFVDDPNVAVRAGHVAMVRPPSTADGATMFRLVDSPVAAATVTGCVAVATYLSVAATSISWPTRVALVCALGLLCLASLVDVKTLRLPNRFVAGAAVFIALALSLAESWDSAFVATGMAAAPFLLIHLVDPSAFGFGDVKFAAAAGALLATWWWPAAVVMVVVALGCACAARLFRPVGPLPFGPSLFAGTLNAVVLSIVLVEKGLVT